MPVCGIVKLLSLGTVNDLVHYCTRPSELILLESIILSLVFCVALFNASSVTLVTGHLLTTDRRKLNETWGFKALRHVSD